MHSQTHRQKTQNYLIMYITAFFVSSNPCETKNQPLIIKHKRDGVNLSREHSKQRNGKYQRHFRFHCQVYFLLVILLAFHRPKPVQTMSWRSIAVNVISCFSWFYHWHWAKSSNATSHNLYCRDVGVLFHSGGAKDYFFKALCSWFHPNNSGERDFRDNRSPTFLGHYCCK